MGQMTIELVCLSDGEVLVPALTLSSLLRQVSEEVGDWSQPEADPPTVAAVRELLDGLADRIDTDCIAVASEAVEPAEDLPRAR
ncbi:hypothetical protein [Streptacidiphilus monticola]|uniref:Uncharacterized protein n=1 Tax=Streptacidiphilus monticola TaxID=2161674 RepID=A0ABW1FW79_9ACTN